MRLLRQLRSHLHWRLKNGWIASAAICSNMVRSTRLPNNASIFRAELYAITLAMHFVRRSRNSNFVIFSDSMSSLEAPNGFKFELDLVQKIIKDYTYLINNGKSIIFCWIPSHVNITGNEKADTTAKSALSFPITKMKLPAYDLIPRVSKFCLEEWQDIWNCCSGNKLHAIYPVVGTAQHNKIHKRLKIRSKFSPTFRKFCIELPMHCTQKPNLTKRCQMGRNKWRWCEPNKVAPHSECKCNHRN